MRTYEELIDYVVLECTQGNKGLKHHKWAAYMLLAEAYKKTEEQVCEDINVGIANFEKNQKEKRKKESKDAHEARRLANLSKK